MEHTLLIVKPDAVAAGKVGSILAMVTDAGFRIVAMEMRRLCGDEARAFYEVHREKGFYEGLVAFMTSGPVVLCVVEAEGAVTSLRTLVGDTDPSMAGPGTVRALFGSTIRSNAVHASDSIENAHREVMFFFPAARLLARGAP